MINPRLAERYAKSLVDLAQERGKLEEVYKDMKFLHSIAKSNPDFVAVLRSPIIKTDKKNKIIESITTGRIDDVTMLFIRLISSKGRESLLPEIVKSVITQYNTIKGIHKVKLVTATELSEEVKNDFIRRIQASGNIKTIELDASVDERIIGGFVLEMEGRLVDASISRDLADVKKQFMNNDYIHKLR